MRISVFCQTPLVFALLAPNGSLSSQVLTAIAETSPILMVSHCGLACSLMRLSRLTGLSAGAEQLLFQASGQSLEVRGCLPCLTGGEIADDSDSDQAMQIGMYD